MLIVLVGWGCNVQKNQTTMSKRQSILKSVYPVLTGVTRFFGVNNTSLKPDVIVDPSTSVFDIPFELNSGDSATLLTWKGKKILIVNTASDCGYTAQYEELQSLYNKYKDELIIVAFPANDFKEQEKGSNEEIASFCKKNYGVEFPIAAKSSVVKGKEQHPLFVWLSTPALNGWNSKEPSWNFSKYLLNEKGQLLGYFDPGVSPMNKQIISLLKAKTK